MLYQYINIINNQLLNEQFKKKLLKGEGEREKEEKRKSNYKINKKYVRCKISCFFFLFSN